MSNKKEDNIQHTVKQAGLGAGLFTAIVIVGGLILLLRRVGK